MPSLAEAIALRTHQDAIPPADTPSHALAAWFRGCITLRDRLTDARKHPRRSLAYDGC